MKQLPDVQASKPLILGALSLIPPARLSARRTSRIGGLGGPSTGTSFSGKYLTRKLALSLAFSLGLALLAPLVAPPPAYACFFWQACARRRGRASNTRAAGKRTGFVRGGNDSAIPYVITPRNTWLGQPPDHIRWNPVADANSYTVRLWYWAYGRNAPSSVLWETRVEGLLEGRNAVEFPDVPIELGAYYSIEVITDRGVSSSLDEGVYDAGFQRLATEDYELLRSHLAQVNADNADAPTEAAALATAGVYFLDELYADALQVLEPLARDVTASELVHIALGDTYSETGLNQLALEAYQQALAIAVAKEDRLSQAFIQVKLADVYATLEDVDQARQLLLTARQIYAELGESLEVSLLDRRIRAQSPR